MQPQAKQATSSIAAVAIIGRNVCFSLNLFSLNLNNIRIIHFT
jgi:hypothetical protein